MLPSLLARDIQQGITQFLITGFEPADGFFHGVMRRFVDNEAAWMKGPYLQVGLPFRHDSAGRDFFSTFQTEHPAYTHQCAAWQRLTSDRMAAHTLVATGTGSGKTECFSLSAAGPLCARPAGRRGGHQGARHLPDECPGHGPGAALCSLYRHHAGLPRAAGGSVCRRQRRRSRVGHDR